MKKTTIIMLGVALAVNLIVGIMFGLNKPMESDAELFLQIAQSVADGDGYRLREGFWPDTPTMSRAPGWTLLVAGALRFKHALGGMEQMSDDAVMRLLCLVLNALNAMLVLVLTRKLGFSKSAQWIAGCGYLLYPTALYHAVNGWSEVLFISLCLLGILLIFEKGWWVPVGGLLFGIAAMVRINVILLPAALIAIGCLRGVWRKYEKRRLLLGLIALCLYVLPAGMWTARNYKACGEFPVLSTLRGQTFYGGNNQIVSSLGEYWGYWLFPDKLPGQETMHKLALTMSELEVDRYYMEKGRKFLIQHLHKVPVLWLGKMVRAYVPIPWKPSVGLYVLNLYRALMYLLIGIGIFQQWKRTPLEYRLVALSLAAVNLFTVIVFWGCARFAFALEPLFMPFMGAGLVCLIERRQRVDDKR